MLLGRDGVGKLRGIGDCGDVGGVGDAVDTGEEDSSGLREYCDESELGLKLDDVCTPEGVAIALAFLGVDTCGWAGNITDRGGALTNAIREMK